jgi:hypothetical protein
MSWFVVGMGMESGWGGDGADLKVGQYRKERGGRSEVRPLHLGVANLEIHSAKFAGWGGGGAPGAQGKSRSLAR